MDHANRQPRAKLLIVDDEIAQMRALCKTLQDEGYEVSGFSAGKDALAALRGSNFDALLTDLQMPGMDGIALVSACQEMDPHLVCIVMTGHGAIETAVGAMKAGALDYIQKPFRLSEIMPVIARALLIRQLRGEKAALEAGIHKRTSELEIANRELESFSYSVSHDLRAPLRSVIGHVNALIDDHGAQLPEEVQKSLQGIRASSQRMGVLIDDLLELAHVSRQEMFDQCIDMTTLTRQVAEDVRGIHPDHDAKVAIAELPPCIGDESLLRQVFINLLSNAFKYTRRSASPQIEVGADVHLDEAVYFVRDNGAGFDMKYKDKLFTVFGRLHRTAEFEGTGVGLSIVQRVVERHGGRVWGEGEVGKGATFYFSLPRA